MSILWSIAPQASLLQSTIVVQIFICMSVLYLHYARQESIDPLLDIVMWAGYVLTFYSFKFYGVSAISRVFEVGGRLGNAYANINSIALVTSFSVAITVFRILFDKLKWYHFFAIANVILIAASGSKKALICLLFIVTVLTFIRYSSKNWLIALLRFMLVGVVLFFLFRLLLELPIFSAMNKRMETMINSLSGHGMVDESTFMRQWLIRIGWEQFLQTPFLGIGLGSSGALLLATIGWETYMHNNYIELLSGIGFIGTAIYYAMFLVPAWQLFRQRYSKDKNTWICLVLLANFLLMDWGLVSYSAKQTYFYIMMFFIQVKINNRHLQEENYEQIQKNHSINN